MSATKSEVPVAGGSLASFQFFEGAGPPVVAVHGITANSHVFVPIARALAPRATLLAPDLRGRAASRELGGPFGLDAHVRDVLAVLDIHEQQEAVLIGHSLGAYIIARLAVLHPDRVKAVILIDGGLRIPGSQVDDPQAFLETFLGATLARLAMRFASREEYHAWWRAHPAFAAGDVEDEDLTAYADHDLIGSPPELRSSVQAEAVRADGADVILGGDNADRLEVPATLLCAPLGLQAEPNPMQPLDLVRQWQSAEPGRRKARQLAGMNHYTIALSTQGAAAVADAVASYI